MQSPEVERLLRGVIDATAFHRQEQAAYPTFLHIDPWPRKPNGALAALARISGLLGATSGASVGFAGAPPHAFATRLASR